MVALHVWQLLSFFQPRGFTCVYIGDYIGPHTPQSQTQTTGHQRTGEQRCRGPEGGAPQKAGNLPNLLLIELEELVLYTEKQVRLAKIMVVKHVYQK